MTWNHRILAHKHNDDVYLEIHEVYYNEDGIPDSYTANAITIGSEELKGIRWTLNKIQECLKKPILWAGENFPQECTVKYTCSYCRKDNFDKPEHHICHGKFRKTKGLWEVNYK